MCSAPPSSRLEIQSFFRTKFLVRLRVVDAYAENYCADFRVIVQIVLETLRLDRAATGEIFRIKIEHDPFAFVILETDLRSVTGHEAKTRRRCAGRGLSWRIRALHKRQCSEADNC